jgi:hypothetical protein
VNDDSIFRFMGQAALLMMWAGIGLGVGYLLYTWNEGDDGDRRLGPPRPPLPIDGDAMDALRALATKAGLDIEGVDRPALVDAEDAIDG